MNACPVEQDIDNHLMLISKQERTEMQVESELIDGDHLDEFTEHLAELSGEGLKELADYLLKDIVSKNVYLGEHFETFVNEFKNSIAEKISE